MKRLGGAWAVLLLAAGTARGGTYTWDWHVGGTGSSALSNAAGAFQSIHAEFNPETNRFTWITAFSDRLTDGFALTVNSGPNPRGIAGELGLIYFDATAYDGTNPDGVRVSAYGYNGQNLSRSWADGDGDGTGGDADVIHTFGGILGSIIEARVDDVGESGRIFSLVLDASAINTHDSPYGSDAEWSGLGFGDRLGLGMHTYRGLGTEYTGDGALSAWSVRGDEGWFDGSDFQTVPMPNAASMGAATMVIVIAGLAKRMRSRHRRRATTAGV